MILKCLLTLVSMLLVFPSLSSERAQRAKEGTIYYLPDAAPVGFDPNVQDDMTSFFWIGHIYEGLMTTDSFGSVLPGVAESVQLSADGKTYTFKLRQHAYWHDGKPVLAKHFVDGFRRLVSPKTKSSYSFIAATAQILNAAAITQGKLPESKLGVYALGRYTLRIKLESPVNFLPTLLAHPSFSPIRKDIVRKYGKSFGKRKKSIVGNGPFKLKSMQSGRIELEKYGSYWNAAAVHIESIVAPGIEPDDMKRLKLYKAGKVDFTLLDTKSYTQSKKQRIPSLTVNDGGVTYLVLNQKSRQGLFSNKYLRRAVKYAINRKKIIQKLDLPQLKPAFFMVTDIIPGAIPGRSFRQESPISWEDGDMANAKRNYDIYKKQTGRKLRDFKITVRNRAQDIRTAAAVSKQLSRVFQGTQISVEVVDFRVRLQRGTEGKFDMMLAGWLPDYLDAMTYLDMFIYPDDGSLGYFYDSQYAKAMVQARRETDLVKRAKLMQFAEKRLMSLAGVVPIFSSSESYVKPRQIRRVGFVPTLFRPDFRWSHWRYQSKIR